MEEFDFYLDEKASVWFRTYFSIKAKNREEAHEQAKKFVLRGDHTDHDWNMIDDTIERLPVHQNCDQATEELYEQTDGKVIWDNTQFDQ